MSLQPRPLLRSYYSKK